MYISIDIGGTHIRVALSKDLKKVQLLQKFRNPKSYNKAIAAIFSIINEKVDTNRIKSIMIGLPGLLDRKKGEIIYLPNLKSWKGQKIVKDFKKEFNSTIHIDNDTALAALGEAHSTYCRSKKRVGYLAIGTGVGGALIEDKKISINTIFEPGHQIVSVDADSAKLGLDLESLVSGTALLSRYGNPPNLKAKAWNEVGFYLGLGLVNCTVMWSPDIIVIGGGVAQVGDKLLRPAVKHYQRNLKVMKPVKIVISKQFDQANLKGGFINIKNYT